MNELRQIIDILESIEDCTHFVPIKLAEDGDTSAGLIEWCGNCGSVSINGAWHKPQSDIWRRHKFAIGRVRARDYIAENRERK